MATGHRVWQGMELARGHLEETLPSLGQSLHPQPGSIPVPGVGQTRSQPLGYSERVLEGKWTTESSPKSVLTPALYLTGRAAWTFPSLSASPVNG